MSKNKIDYRKFCYSDLRRWKQRISNVERKFDEDFDFDDDDSEDSIFDLVFDIKTNIDTLKTLIDRKLKQKENSLN